jgi:hypothetical protein
MNRCSSTRASPCQHASMRYDIQATASPQPPPLVLYYTNMLQVTAFVKSTYL